MNANRQMYADLKEELLLTREQIAARVQEMGRQITEDFRGRDLTVICILKGAVVFFVDLVREYHSKNDFSDLEIAIKHAIDQCIRENVLKDFLIQHREEVTHMMTMDYTFERRLELQREEAIEEGREEGRELKLREQVRKKLLKSKSLEQVADELEETPDAIRSLYEQIKEEMADRNFEKD